MKLIVAKKIIVYSIALLLLYYIWTLFHILDLLCYIFQLILPLIIAIFFHFMLEPIIHYFDNDRIKRKSLVIYLYLVFTLFILIIGYKIAPCVLDECLSFYKLCYSGRFKINPIFTNIYHVLEKYQIVSYFIKRINGWTHSFIYWITQIVLAVSISFYLSYDNLHLIEKCIIYLPFHKQGIVMQSLKRIQLMTYQFMKSIFLDFIFFFILSCCSFYFIDKNMFIWISLFLSLTNLIPYIGPYLGGIPIVIYEYMINSNLGYYSLVIVIILQYIESSYIQPYLFSKGIKIHPIWLFLALSLFGDLFGIIGMIFSPLFASYLITLFHLIKELNLLKECMNFINKNHKQ